MQDDDKAQDFLLNNNDKNMLLILSLDSVATFTLCSGWTDDIEEAFANAIERVIDENPILTSCLLRKKTHLYARPAVYTRKNHQFFTSVKDMTNDMQNFQTHKDQLHFMIHYLGPKVQTAVNRVRYEIKYKKPLFHVHLFRFRNGYACYHVAISHALVDITTYYNIIGQISSFMNQEQISKIQWGRTPHILSYPSHYTEKDKSLFSLSNLLVGFIRYKFRTRKYPKNHIWAFPKEKLAMEKKKQVDIHTHPYISSNDLIVSSISRASCPSFSLEMWIVMNLRPRDTQRFQLNDGGIYLQLFTMPSKVSSNPNHVRTAVDRGYYYDAKEVDSKPIRYGHLHMVTSWVSGYQSLKGVATLCHCPDYVAIQSRARGAVSIVFHLDEDHIGIYHNVLKLDDKEMENMKDWVTVLQ